MTETAKIASKLHTAMKMIDAVAKRGINDAQRYSYVKAADVANEVRKALDESKIAFTYSVLSERSWESETKSGTTQFFVSLTVRARFTDTETGEYLEADGIGWGADTQDKAPYKAMTGALKYILRMNFLIPDESDPEAGAEHESVAVVKPKPAPTAASVYAAAGEGHQCRIVDVKNKEANGAPYLSITFDPPYSGTKYASVWKDTLFAMMRNGASVALSFKTSGKYLNVTDAKELVAANAVAATEISDDDMPF